MIKQAGEVIKWVWSKTENILHKMWSLYGRAFRIEDSGWPAVKAEIEASNAGKLEQNKMPISIVLASSAGSFAAAGFHICMLPFVFIGKLIDNLVIVPITKLIQKCTCKDAEGEQASIEFDLTSWYGLEIDRNTVCGAIGAWIGFIPACITLGIFFLASYPIVLAINLAASVLLPTLGVISTIVTGAVGLVLELFSYAWEAIKALGRACSNCICGNEDEPGPDPGPPADEAGASGSGYSAVLAELSGPSGPEASSAWTWPISNSGLSDLPDHHASPLATPSAAARAASDVPEVKTAIPWKYI